MSEAEYTKINDRSQFPGLIQSANQAVDAFNRTPQNFGQRTGAWKKMHNAVASAWLSVEADRELGKRVWEVVDRRANEYREKYRQEHGGDDCGMGTARDQFTWKTTLSPIFGGSNEYMMEKMAGQAGRAGRVLEVLREVMQ